MRSPWGVIPLVWHDPGRLEGIVDQFAKCWKANGHDESPEGRLVAQAQQISPGLTHQCLYFEQPHTFEQILFIQTAEPALVGHA